MPKWTAEQQQAINARNHTILVSAAAGSGKTAVLIERIVSLVREGYRLNRMLIVTFTKAAAGEMRQRLKERLTKEAMADPQVMGGALDDLEGTDISTIHAFCQHVIRTNFQAVGIDPLVRVCDDQQRKTLFDAAYREAMNDLLGVQQPDKDFLALVDAFNQRELAEMTESLYAFLMAMPAPFDWMRNVIEADSHESLRGQKWYRTLLSQAKLELDGLPIYMEAQAAMFEEPDAVPGLRITLEKDRETVEYIGTACEAQEEDRIPDILSEVGFATAARTTKLTEEQKEWKKRYFDARGEMKEAVLACRKSLELDEEQSGQDMEMIRSFLRGLYVLIRRVHGNYIVTKNQENVIDFSDMEQMTMEILEQAEFRESLQREYDHIFVDECQDVSAIQDAIVQAIHGQDSCLFMVGDVKQSIYRFRLADPTLFLNRMRTYSDAEDAQERRIFLQKNFRSRTNVLDATNRVFRSAMQRRVTELDYLPEDELISGRNTVDDPPVEIRLACISEDDKSKERQLEAETAIVVRRIRELLTTTIREGDTERTYQYRDMVILLAKAAGVGARLTELLEEAGIPVFFDGKDDYYGLPEIRNVKALMSVLDNHMQDVPLLTVLKMIPFSFTEGDLAQVRVCRTGRDVPYYAAFEAACGENNGIGEKCRQVKEKLDEWRFRRETMRLSDFVWHVIRDSGYYAACGAFPEGELRQANLRLFCQKAAEYEAIFDGALSGFLQMIDQQVAAEDSKSAKVLGEGENLVRIMTMHKSKGLEFPVVFCMRLSADPRGRGQGILRMHNQLGLYLPYANPELNIRRDHACAAAFKYQKTLDETAERCRLLYVAMTRAREHLILTGTVDEKDPSCWRMPRGEYRVWKAGSMMDWVMQAVMDDAKGEETDNRAPIAFGPWQLTFEEAGSITAHKTQRREEEVEAWLRQVVAISAEDGYFPWWNEAERPAAVRPIKTSVTSLAKQAVLHDPMPLSDDEETMEDKREGEEIISPLRLSEVPAKPAFMEARMISGAERGTVMHHILSLIDLKQVSGAAPGMLDGILREAIDGMTEAGILAEGETNLVNLWQLRAWFTGPLGKRMLASDEVHREWSFNLMVNQREGTLLQGVIDCAFIENGQWVLVDYKTDRIEDEQAFVDRHALQLSWYARALEKITGRPVAEMWLYSLGKGKAYPVTAVPIAAEE